MEHSQLDDVTSKNDFMQSESEPSLTMIEFPNEDVTIVNTANVVGLETDVTDLNWDLEVEQNELDPISSTLEHDENENACVEDFESIPKDVEIEGRSRNNNMQRSKQEIETELDVETQASVENEMKETLGLDDIIDEEIQGSVDNEDEAQEIDENMHEETIASDQNIYGIRQGSGEDEETKHTTENMCAEAIGLDQNKDEERQESDENIDEEIQGSLGNETSILDENKDVLVSEEDIYEETQKSVENKDEETPALDENNDEDTQISDDDIDEEIQMPVDNKDEETLESDENKDDDMKENEEEISDSPKVDTVNNSTEDDDNADLNKSDAGSTIEDGSEYPKITVKTNLFHVSSIVTADKTDMKKVKKRRRIVVINDDESDSEKSEENELLKFEESPVPSPQSPLRVSEELLLLSNEKPKPKSKKNLTRVLKQMQAQRLLESAVIIQAAGRANVGHVSDQSGSDTETTRKPKVQNAVRTKKRKILESSGDESDLESRTLITEPLPTYEIPSETMSLAEPLECVIAETLAVQITETLDSDNAEFLKDNEQTQNLDLSGKSEEANGPDSVTDIVYDALATTDNQIVYDKTDNSSSSDFVKDDGNSSKNENAEEHKDGNAAKAPGAPVDLKNRTSDSGNSTDSGNLRKQISEPDPFSEVERGVTDSDSESDSQVPNEVYFGTPDRTVYRSSNSGRGGWGRPLGRGSCFAASSTAVNTLKPLSSIVPKPLVMKAPTKPVRSYGDSDEEDSRHIPNDIYFGDVQVSNQVCFTFHNENDKLSPPDTSESESEVDEYRPPTLPRGIRAPIPHPRARGRKPTRISRRPTLSQPVPQSEIELLKKCFQAAGIKVKYNRLFEGCKSERHRINAMIEFLQDRGLEGAPSITKCRALRKINATKREIAELDTSVIIETRGEGRTRRSAMPVVAKDVPKPSMYYDIEQRQRTISLMKSVVDSDSE